MGSIILLARRNRHRETILLRWHWTDYERIVSAEWVRRFIEIQDDAPVLRRIGVQEPSRAISELRASLIAEDEEEQEETGEDRGWSD